MYPPGTRSRATVNRVLPPDCAGAAVGARPVTTRRPGAVTLPPGVQAVYGDCDDPTSLDAAFDGIDRAFLMSAQASCSAEHPTHDLHLMRASRLAGERHIVKLSVYSGCAGDYAIGVWNREAEAAVMDSGIDWTSGPPRS